MTVKIWSVSIAVTFCLADRVTILDQVSLRTFVKAKIWPHLRFGLFQLKKLKNLPSTVTAFAIPSLIIKKTKTKIIIIIIKTYNVCIKMYETILKKTPNMAEITSSAAGISWGDVALTDSRLMARSNSSCNPPVTQVATPLIMQNFKA